MYTLWNSTGLIEEYATLKEAMIIAREWWSGYQDQRITLSWKENGEQIEKVLYDGRCLERAAGWKEICWMVKDLERGWE